MFESTKCPTKVCKLQKALHGLKQSGRKWNEKLDGILKIIGFNRCNVDTCVYTITKGNHIIILVVYVDDILLVSSNEDDLKEVKSKIGMHLEIQDKGPVVYFLGMEVKRNTPKGPLQLSQRRMILELLKETCMENVRKVSTPLDPGQKFKKCTDNCENCKKVDSKVYQSIIGSLMYIGLCTRPDILHAVTKLSQFNNDPHVEHLNGAHHVLRYLNATVDQCLEYRSTGKPLHGFVDSDWAGSSDDRKSFTGFVFILAGGAVMYESKKQPTVALSSTEAEYMALSAATKEVIYIRNMLIEIGFARLVKNATTLYGDNIGSQQLVRNPVYHSRSKHIDIKVHHLRDVYKEGKIDLKYVPSNENTADILTKSLGKIKNKQLSDKLGFQ